MIASERCGKDGRTMEMRKMDDQQLIALSLLMATYPQAIVGEMGRAVWEHFLADVRGDMLLKIVTDWIAEHPEAPAIADMLNARDAIEGVDWETNWREVKLILLGRRWAEPNFTCDPIILEAVQAAGGWEALRWMKPEDEPWRKKDFHEGWKMGHMRASVNRAQLASGPARKELGHG
jgi:hypothetical protein